MNRKDIFKYIKKKYGTEPDYPFKRGTDRESAVFRHKKSRKWYGLIIKVERSRLGLEGEGLIDVLDVKADPELISMIKYTPGFLPGYHMNHQHWLSILLDGSVPDMQIKSLIDTSYEMTKTE